jgi:DNA-binding NarL/FixJ family response regulator
MRAPRHAFESGVGPVEVQTVDQLRPELGQPLENRPSLKPRAYTSEHDEGPTKRIPVLLANTSGLFADGLNALLRSDPRIDVLGKIADDELPLELELPNEPIVVLIECLFSIETCPEMLARITGWFSSLRPLVVTRALDDDELSTLIAAGAFGCLTPDCRGDELIRAIERVSQGDVLFPPTLLMRLLTQQSQRERSEAVAGASGADEPEQPAATAKLAAPAVGSLAPRERQVLETLALGLSTEEVADRLGITVHTIRSHLKNVLVKLNAHSKLEAVVIALREGLIDLPR